MGLFLEQPPTNPYSPLQTTVTNFICFHKTLFESFAWQDLVSMLVILIGVSVSAGAGIGGGGIAVPVLIAISGFLPFWAIPISNVRWIPGLLKLTV